MSDTTRNSSALGRLCKEEQAEYWAALALRCSKGIGARSARRLLAHFGSAYAALQQVPRWGEAGVSPNKGVALSRPEWRQKARPEWENSRDLDGCIVLWTSPHYPEQLKELPDAPVLLYARGDLTLLRRACVAVVGSRACTPSRVRITRELAGQLAASGITVVSGMARGIDGTAHAAALDQPGGTIAVLGAGLDVLYPPEHLELYRQLGQKGLLLSEFPPGTPPDGRHFPVRNRIISGLSLGVVVVEGALRSGSLVTARLALEHNRAVYAVPPEHDQAKSEPGSENSEGCAELLEQGARPCLCAEDILEDLYPLLRGLVPHSAPHKPQAEHFRPAQTPHSPKPILAKAASTPEKNAHPAPDFPPDSPESLLLDALRDHGPMLPDDLSTLPGLDLAPGQISATLLILELRGLVRRLPGMRYELPL